MNRLVTNDKSQVQVIARAATILRALEEENSGLSLARSTAREPCALTAASLLRWKRKPVNAATPGRVRLGPTILARFQAERLRAIAHHRAPSKSSTKPSIFHGRTTLSSSIR
jgi:hypothetical protein